MINDPNNSEGNGIESALRNEYAKAFAEDGERFDAFRDAQIEALKRTLLSDDRLRSKFDAALREAMRNQIWLAGGMVGGVDQEPGD